MHSNKNQHERRHHHSHTADMWTRTHMVVNDSCGCNWCHIFITGPFQSYINIRHGCYANILITLSLQIPLWNHLTLLQSMKAQSCPVRSHWISCFIFFSIVLPWPEFRNVTHQGEAEVGRWYGVEVPKFVTIH